MRIYITLDDEAERAYEANVRLKSESEKAENRRLHAQGFGATELEVSTREITAVNSRYEWGCPSSQRSRHTLDASKEYGR